MLKSQLMSAADATATQTSSGFQKGDLSTFSVQFKFSGASAGSVSLDCSNDNATWIQVSGSPITISAGEAAMINVTNAGYQWVRAVWTPSAGTGTITADLVVLQPANRF